MVNDSNTPSPETHLEPVAWLRNGENVPVQNVPLGAMWISDKDDPRAFPVYASTLKPRSRGSDPLFWYRPVGDDGGYEGPHHASSAEFSAIPADMREQWKPLYSAAASSQESLRDLVKKLGDAYQKVSVFPEEDPDGLSNLLALRNLVPEAIELMSTFDIVKERERRAEIAASAVMKFRHKVGGRYYPGYHEDMRDAVREAVKNG